jgi:hypothetical protein
VLLASTGMLHCAANFRAMTARIPAIGMTLEYLPSGAITEDMTKVAERKYFVAVNVFGPDPGERRVTLHGQAIRDDLRAGLSALPIWMQEFLRGLLDLVTSRGHSNDEGCVQGSYCCPAARPPRSVSRHGQPARRASGQHRKGLLGLLDVSSTCSRLKRVHVALSFHELPDVRRQYC